MSSTTITTSTGTFSSTPTNPINKSSILNHTHTFQLDNSSSQSNSVLGTPDWSKLVVLQQWRSQTGLGSVEDVLNSDGTKYESLKKSIVVNSAPGVAPVDSVDDIIWDDAATTYKSEITQRDANFNGFTGGGGYGRCTYIYRAVKPFYIGQFTKVDKDSSHSDCFLVVGKTIEALKYPMNLAYRYDRAIMNTNIDGTQGGNWLIPIIPKSDHFYFRICSISSYGLQICIIPMCGSSVTSGKDCYYNTKERGSDTVATHHHYCNYLSNIIKDL